MRITRRVRNVDDFKNGNDWVKSYCKYSDDRVDYLSFSTLSGCRWESMKERTKSYGSVQRLNPCYIGVKNLFKDFNSFVEWSRAEFGYSNKDDSGKFWQLDKDLLTNTKVYSTETCLFIPQSLNKLFILPSNTNGFPIGVSVHSQAQNRENKYRAILYSGKTYQLGSFNEVMDAHRAWQKAKCSLIKEQMDIWRMSGHNKLFNSLEEKFLKIRSDIENFKETKGYF